MNPRVNRITFSNGEIGTCDCRALLELGVFQELKEEAYFRQARAIAGIVVWPHEPDICPDTLYLDSQKSAPART
jgi:hypothetical protein